MFEFNASHAAITLTDFVFPEQDWHCFRGLSVNVVADSGLTSVPW